MKAAKKAAPKRCSAPSLPSPLWLEKNIRDFKRRARTRFTADNFLEALPFDYMEIEVLEE